MNQMVLRTGIILCVAYSCAVEASCFGRFNPGMGILHNQAALRG